MSDKNQVTSLEEQVFIQLEEDIISGFYAKGENITELGVCSRLGVSRTPVRGALHRLAEEGLVDITAVVFPESVENTGSFQGCVNLEYLLFKGSPTYTGDTYSFENTKLTHVYLSDTKDEAISYIPYLAAACKAVEAQWYYADAWAYDSEGNPVIGS